ncbi:restriction endonuclease subunit S [Melaminivora jejuensis]|uniref:restriction endonuclease subunit S n=1 Tax=Melaminivora jejuensis TaxID=1267217 RepID=UPI001ADFAB5F|nr:restriction endonuclease subunit S [Melaminivora jejuensis]UHJ66493.1 restriction endonuclease subunit S [Melaminivora jejuensis]
MSWPEMRFGSLFLEPSRNGLYKAKEFHGDGAKIINMGELFAYPFVGCQQMKRLQVTNIELARFGVSNGDLLFARRSLIEAGAGKCVIVENLSEPTVFESSIIRVRLDTSRTLPRFYYYYFRSPIGRSRIEAIITGAAQKGIRSSELADISIHAPPLEEQRRIAFILSAYDDLIENNTRRIAILEEMARRIYEEWFVHFRFPGHEQVKMVESELGLIPEGWSFKPITTIATVKYGKGLPTKYLVENGDYPVYGAAKIIGRFNEYTCENRTLIVGCRGSVGVPQITLPRCFVTNNSFTINPQNPNGMLWLFQALKYRGLNDVIGGAAQPQITIEGLDNAKMLTPGDTFLEKYNEAVLPLFNLAWNLQFQNANLRTTRDLLLPKLISGELDVSNLPEPGEAIAA